MNEDKEKNTTEPAEVEGEETPEEEKDYQELYLRTLAELDNYRKRVERDRDQARRYAAENLMRSLLPVLDALELATDCNDAPEDYRKGVRLAFEDLLRILGEHGMESIEALNQPFDPRFHEAVGMLPDPERPAGTVVEEERRGYRFGDRVLRASRVRVSVQPPEASDTKEAEAEDR